MTPAHPAPAPSAAQLDALQQHLDTALADGGFTGGAAAPAVDVRELVADPAPRFIDLDDVGTRLKLEYDRSTVRIEATNPMQGFERMRLVTTAGPGYIGLINFGC